MHSALPVVTHYSVDTLQPPQERSLDMVRKTAAAAAPDPDPDPDPDPEPESKPSSSNFPPLEPDPRTVERVCVSNIDIDPQVQRDIDQDVVLRIATGFDWNKFEAPTCSRSKRGKLRAIEGQHRTLGLRMRDPKAVITVFVTPGEASTQVDAEIALGIAGGRRGHTPYDRWQLRVHQGGVYEIAAEEVLDTYGLRIGKGTTASALGCINAIHAIITVKRKTPDEGADALDSLLQVLLGAYPTPRNAGDPGWENVITRFDSRIVKAVGAFIDRNPHFEMDRLISVLHQRTAYQWLSEAATSSSERRVWNRIGEIITFRYNKHFQPNSDRRARW